MDTVEIYFADLIPETQREVLALYNVNSPEELNDDVFPLFILQYEED